MVDSIDVNTSSNVSSTGSVNELSEEEKKKKKAQEEEGLFSFGSEEQSGSNSGTQISEDTAKSTAQSYIATLKAQYPQLAAKLDSYYASLDIASLCADVSSVSDIKAYIYSETKIFLN